jgi:hypothetical protein
MPAGRLQRLDLGELLLRQTLRPETGDAGLARNLVRHGGAIARQHDEVIDAEAPQSLRRRSRLGANGVREQDHPDAPLIARDIQR